MSSHAAFLQLQGQNSEEVDHIGLLELDKSNLSEKYLALLAYVKVLTLTPAETQDIYVERCRKAGWTDDEIFDATFTTAFFAFFNRMADAYGLDYVQSAWVPPVMRKGQENR